MTTSLDLEAALVRVVSAGGDTDTNGAVAGAVLGARTAPQPFRSGGLTAFPGGRVWKTWHLNW